MTELHFIDAPYFSLAELARIAGIDRAVADQWVHRQLLRPALVKRAGSLKRPFFSARAIFKAKLIVALNEHLSFGPGQSAAIANDSDSKEVATEVADMVAGEDWAYYAARCIERSRPMKLVMVVSRIKNCWRWKLVGPDDPNTEPYGAGIPAVILPLASIFEPVYRACREIHAEQMTGNTKARRGRS